MTLNFLRAWARNRRWLLAAFLCQDLLLGLSAFAFPEAAGTLGYVLSLSVASQALLIGCDAWKEARHTERVQNHLHEGQPMLQETNSTLAEQAIWEALLESRHDLLASQQAYQANYHEQLDYYTLWAHQIKTPMAAARLLVEQLDATGPLRPLLQQELFKIGQYVDLVLHYLRMENFHQDLQLERLNLETVVHQVVKKYASFFIHQPLTLELDNLDYSLVSDAKWLELLIDQLVSNAVKYTPQGTIRISQADGILTIADTGIGIQDQDIPRIFERGFTGFNGRVSQQSSGLGLYLCQHLCRNLGIPLALTSQLGQGTQVTLDLNQATLAQD